MGKNEIPGLKFPEMLLRKFPSQCCLGFNKVVVSHTLHSYTFKVMPFLLFFERDLVIDFAM